MSEAISLQEYLGGHSGADVGKRAVCDVIYALADASITISKRVALGDLAGSMSHTLGVNSDGDVQKALDVDCDDTVMQALARAPVAEIASEEADAIILADPDAPLAVAVDPLDGSSNIDTNLSIGTIFSVLPKGRPGAEALGSFGGPGTRQLAAGFTIYGPQTALVLTMGAGVQVFTLDGSSDEYRLTRTDLRIPSGTREYAINASNYRHWEQPVRTYVDDCMSGASGVRGSDFNMRWMGSLVAEAFQILARGGIFLYPADKRPGYENGRLRLLYEAHPMAFLMEQAGGGATTGRQRILDIAATSLHQRVPLILGSADKVERVTRLHLHPDSGSDSAPLFARRGLFRQ